MTSLKSNKTTTPAPIGGDIADRAARLGVSMEKLKQFESVFGVADVPQVLREILHVRAAGHPWIHNADDALEELILPASQWGLQDRS